MDDRPPAPAIAILGHIGLRCYDVNVMRAFYRDVLGFVQTDEDVEAGFVFLSAQPAAEHHQLLLARGRSVEKSGGLIQQLSFRCHSLDDVLGYFRRFVATGVPIDMIVSHGNAVGVYFFDPEGNRCEVYWDTGLHAKQPFVEPLDLSQPAEAIMEQIRQRVADFGSVGYQDPAWRARALAQAAATKP
jgi:catechol 2,3-dioxygenase-like lactoylglutathione lyase family enzyme